LGLALGLLVLATGCPDKKKAPPYSEVSGTVFFKGQPLPGGRLSFVNDQGFAGGANIDEKGHYKISAPIGEVKIGVDNQMLGGGGRGAPMKKPGLKRPDSEEAHPITGRYVKIPDKYYSPQESGLTYTVVSGSQTHDVKME
jgi:hypothetical protein